MLCPKCDGRGYLPEYGYIAGGVCFACNGKGTVADRVVRERKPRAPQTAERKAELAAKREREIIDSELAYADKRAAQTLDGTAILARFITQRAAVHDVGTVRVYAAAVSSACYRADWLALPAYMRNVDCSQNLTGYSSDGEE